MIEASAFSGVGSATSIAANCLPFLLDSISLDAIANDVCLLGPIAADSFVSKPWLFQVLMALVINVNAFCNSQVFAFFLEAKMLAADRSCKTFDAFASDYEHKRDYEKIAAMPLLTPTNVFRILGKAGVNQDDKDVNPMISSSFSW
jgi:hypothetical protein